MEIKTNFSLKNHNTFGIDVPAARFVTTETLEELRTACSTFGDFLVLGGGSNILLTRPVEIPVIHVALKGIEIIHENEDIVKVAVAAGENWHNFVLWAIENDYGGIENLSLIPGNVGTAPMQNIGAYGVEIKDTMDYLVALEVATGDIKTFSNRDCRFGYRNSVFKNIHKGKFIITKVVFKLSKKNHRTNISYGAIKQQLESQGITEPTIKDISNAVIAIRQSKLPDPAELGNSGSFFKNPVVSDDFFNKMEKQFPDLPHYRLSETEVKIPAGWLVEQCGFKGKRFGDAGVHKKQALVLVNYGNASGKEILQLSQKIQATVLQKFGIPLEAEVNIV